MDKITFENLPIAVSQINEKIEKLTSLLLDNSSKPQPTSTEEFITREATARKLGISLPTLHDYTKAGLIPAYRIGSRVRYKVSEIEASLLKVQSVKGKRG